MAIEYDDSRDRAVPEEVSEETVDIPVSMLAGQTASPGDVVRLEIVSVNDDSGTVTVKYATEKPMGGIKEAAATFEA